MKNDEPPQTPTRDVFLAILWERFNDKALAFHPTTIRYGKMIAEYQGWDEPKIHPTNQKLTIRIGGNCN